MIGKTRSGAGFGGLTRYLMTGRKDEPNPDRVLWTSTRELVLEEPREAAMLMRVTAAQGRTDKPVQHLSISLALGEHLTRDQWEQVADTTLRDLGLEGHQVLIVAHQDTAHEHIHLVINRVHPETRRAWDRWQVKRRVMASLRAQELKMELRPTPWVHNPDRVPDTLVQQFERTGEPPLLDFARAAARPIFQEAGSWTEVHERLAEEGLYLQRKGQGLVVGDDHHHVKASSVERSASLRALEARLGPYQEPRPLLQEVDSDLRGDRRVELYAQVEPAFRAHREADSARRRAQEAARRVQDARYNIHTAVAEAFRNPAQVESRYFAHLDQEKALPPGSPSQLGKLKGLVLHAGRTPIPLGDPGHRALEIAAGQLPRFAADYLRAREELARTEIRYAEARKEEAQLRERFRPQFAELEQIQGRSATLSERLLSLSPRDQLALARRHGRHELERAVQRRPESALLPVVSREHWIKNLSPDLNRVLDRRLRRTGLSLPNSRESLTKWTARALHCGLHPLHTVQVLTRGGVPLADAARTVSQVYATIRHPATTARRYTFRSVQKLTGLPVADVANAASLAVGVIRSPAKTVLWLTAKSLGIPSLPVRLATMAWDLVRAQVLSR
jgi:hypothetical protein